MTAYQETYLKKRKQKSIFIFAINIFGYNRLYNIYTVMYCFYNVYEVNHRFSLVAIITLPTICAITSAMLSIS